MLQVQLLNKVLKVSNYNAACTAGMAQSHFSIINNELMNKDPDVVTEQAFLIIFGY